LVEALQRLLRGIDVGRGVDRFEVLGHLVVLPARHVLERVSNEVHDARLHGCRREDRFDRLGEPFEAVHAADQDVLDTTLFEIAVGSGQGAVSGLRPIRFPDPPAEPDVPVPEHPALHRVMPLVLV
jgi:hypothetical protein